MEDIWLIEFMGQSWQSWHPSESEFVAEMGESGKDGERLLFLLTRQAASAGGSGPGGLPPPGRQAHLLLFLGTHLHQQQEPRHLLSAMLLLGQHKAAIGAAPVAPSAPPAAPRAVLDEGRE